MLFLADLYGFRAAIQSFDFEGATDAVLVSGNCVGQTFTATSDAGGVLRIQ